jgi:hypothetical protein
MRTSEKLTGSIFRRFDCAKPDREKTPAHVNEIKYRCLIYQLVSSLIVICV